MSIKPYNNFTVRDLSNVVQPYVNSTSEVGYFSGRSLGTLLTSKWYSLPATLNTNNGIANVNANGGLILQPGVYKINLSLFPTTTQDGSSNISFNFGTSYLSNSSTSSSATAFGGPCSTGMFTYDPFYNPYSPGIISWLADGYSSANSTNDNFVKNPTTNELSYNYYNAGFPNGGALYGGIFTTKITFILDSSATIYFNVSTSSTTGVIMGNSCFTLNLISYLPVVPVKTWQWNQSGLSKYTQSVASSSDMTKIFVGTNEGIYSSSNYGASWTLLNNSNIGNWRSIASNNTSTNIVAGLDNGGIYYSSDASHNTWNLSTTASGGMNPSGSFRGIVSSDLGTRLAAVSYNGSLYTSSNSGVSFSNRNLTQSWTSIASDNTCTKLAATTESGDFGATIYTTVDPFTNFSSKKTGLQWSCIASDSSGQVLVAGEYGGGIWRGTNSGNNWVKSDAPSRNWQTIASSRDGTILIAGINDLDLVNGGIWMSSNSGVNWSKTNAPSSSWQDVALSSDGLKAVAVNASNNINAVYRGVYSFLY